MSFLAPAATAQFQSAFVFASDPKGVAVYTRNDATGILTPVSGSPFPSKEGVTFLALDFKGRYLFTANDITSKISMFSINSNTGVLQEVPNSPFASASTKAPMLLAPEISGQTLYVINFYGSSNLVSSLESFQIDSGNQALVPSQTAAVDLPGLYVGGASHPSGKAFYGYFDSPSPSNLHAASFLVFNGSTGSFVAKSFPSGAYARCFAMDPQGLHTVIGSGSNNGQLYSYGLNADGSLSEFSGNVAVTRHPESLSLDALGQFLYVTLPGGTPQSSTVHMYSPVTLAELPNSPLPANFASTASWLVDPSAPLIFADQVYQVSPADGSLTSLFSSSVLAPPAVFSMPPGSQPVQGPVAQLSPTSFAFGSVSMGVTSSAHQSCGAMLNFTPSATGNRSASLTITDNAAPPSETVALSGTGLTPSPAVTLVPGTLTFGSVAAPVAEGASASSSTTVTNSGSAALHISAIALSGANSSEFSLSAPNCSAAIAVNSNCSVTVTFLPVAAGLRSATIALTDDAPDSPQTIQLNGNAAPAQSPGVTLVPASVTFGSLAAPVAEGASTSSSVNVKNSGGLALHISTIALSGGNASEFSFSAPNCSATIAVNSSCSIAVTFLPVAAGPRSATITLTDDAPNSPQTIQLNGNAAPAVTIVPAAGASTTATVTAGQTAEYNLQMTPGGSYTGIVSLSCSGAPLAATCNLPQSITILSGAAAPFTVRVSTTAAHAFLPVLNFPRAAPPADYRSTPLIVFGALLFACLIFWCEG